MKRLHIIVITIFFNKMTVTGGVCYFLACELQSLQTARSFRNSVETESQLHLWLSKLTLKIELQHSYLKSYQSIIYYTILANTFIITAQGKKQTKKPHISLPIVYTSYYIYKIYRRQGMEGLYFISVHFWTCFLSMQEKVQGMQQLSPL